MSRHSVLCHDSGGKALRRNQAMCAIETLCRDNVALRCVAIEKAMRV